MTIVAGPELRRRALVYGFVAAIGALAVGFMIRLELPLHYPYANDTAGYVEEATNLLAGNGLQRSTYKYGAVPALASQPFFPPGFSIAIASLGALGIAPKAASLAISWASWALLTAAILFALRPLLPGILIPSAIGVTTVTSPGLYEWGFQGLSDAPALLLSVLSIGGLLRGIRQEPGSYRWALVSGLAAGLAYTVRNAALILPATAIAVFTVAVAWRALPTRAVFQRAVAWSFGFAALLLPLLVRNMLVFGKVQPYFAHVGQSHYGWVKAIRVVLWSSLFDLSGSKTVAAIAWSFQLLAAIGIPIAAATLWLVRRYWKHALPEARLKAFALFAFICLGLAMIAIGRVRFDWVETTLTRYVMQYSWALLGVIAMLVASGATPPRSRALARGALVFLCALLTVVHGWFIRNDLLREAKIARSLSSQPDFVAAAESLEEPKWILTNQLRRSIAQDSGLKAYVADMPDQVELISNFGPTLYLETGRPFRDVQASRDQLKRVGQEAAQSDYGRAVVAVVGIFLPTNGILRGHEAGNWQNAILKDLGPGFSRCGTHPNVLIVVRPVQPEQGVDFQCGTYQVS